MTHVEINPKIGVPLDMVGPKVESPKHKWFPVGFFFVLPGGGGGELDTQKAAKVQFDIQHHDKPE